MSLLSDLFGDGNFLDKLHTPQGWTMTSTSEPWRQLQDDPTEEKYFLRRFYDEVCAEAEGIMAHTNTVTGAHYNAMKRVLKRHGVEVE